MLTASEVGSLPLLTGCTVPAESGRNEAANNAKSGDLPGPKTGQSKPNVVIFLSDALGARHLGCYGYQHPTSPTIDRLAEQGYLFERCYAQSSWTRPSVASMLTGMHGSVHQANSREDQDSAGYETQVLQDAFLTVGEAFQAQGYQTAVFQSNTHLQEQHGFMQGFEKCHFQNFVDPGTQMDQVLHWLETEAREPFFLYIHAIDPHHPYNPPQECFQTLFGELKWPSKHDMDIIKNYPNVYGAWVHGHKSYGDMNLAELSPQGVDILRMQYDAEIRHVDNQVKRFLDKLEDLGYRSRTTLSFVADHGEEFREHGAIGHGQSLFDEVLHVPLIISPAGMTKKVRVKHATSMFNLYPSLLTLAGLPVPEGLQAKSLFAANGKCVAVADEAVVSELKWRLIHSVVIEPYKLILDTKTKSVTVYDREADPAEAWPLTSPPPKEYQKLMSSLRAQIRQNEELAAVYGEPEWIRQDNETVEQLKAVGYL